jgi:hypothetical protein
MRIRHLYLRLNNQRGVSAIIVAICLIMLVGFVALAIDVSHLFVVRNELQNAADAGALAGAGNLYIDDGTAINTNANQFGYDAAVANLSEKLPVEVNWSGGNNGDVQRGHWSFGLGDLPRGFYPNASTDTVDLWGVTTEELDADPNFINAVRVRTRRQATPITSFFARIFGRDSFQGSAEAVAYIGFAGTLLPAEVDSPIAICEQALLEKNSSGEDKYDCTVGRFINDALGGQDEETGMWTSFEQHLDPEDPYGEPLGDPCSGGTNASEVKPLIDCNADSGVNPMLYLGQNMEVNNGQIDAAFNKFYNCWSPEYLKTAMPMTLPVIDCVNDPTTCAPLVGAVVVDVVWITQQPNLKDLPTYKEPFLNYDEWKQPSTCDADENPDQCVWDSFVDHYDLRGADGELAEYQAKTIYFLKSCEDHIPEGVTGGENFGILAKIPVLVD